MKKPLIIVLALVVVLGIGGAVFSATRPPTVHISAIFADAYPMAPGNTVKIAGVGVGSVESVEPYNGKAKVVMAVSPEVLPMHTDGRATIITQDLLGERYIGLERGTPGAPILEDGGTLAETQNNNVVDLQDVLNMVDNPTATSLAALITTNGEGLRNNGQNASDTIRALAPTMGQVDKLVKVLNAQNAQLNALIDNAKPVAAAVTSNGGKDLDGLIDSTSNLMNTVGDQQVALGDTLKQLPGTFNSAQRTLHQLGSVAGPMATTLGNLRPTTDNLNQISHEASTWADAAEKPVKTIPHLLDRLNSLLDELRPVANDLRPAAQHIRGVTKSFRQLNSTALPHLTDLMELAKGWTEATTDYDSNGHYFKAILGFSPNQLAPIVTGAIPGAPRTYPKFPLPSPPEAPFNKVGQATMPEGPGDPRTSQPTGGTNADNKSATGLTQGQEHNMIGQMLGGH
jgi:phospholipid/cholesterol/gamma-HCH transport system substrate-binding protein